MLDCCILFLHHRADTTTRAHLRLVRERNPYPVVALCDDSTERVPGALDVGLLESQGAGRGVWYNEDTVLYRWFRLGGVRARRYILLEWDALATMPVREFYQEVWDADAVASSVYYPDKDPHWQWFQDMDRLPAQLRAQAAGLTPMNGILLSHRALAVIADCLPPPEIHCELRIGTLLRFAGFELTQFPAQKRATNSYLPILIHVDPNCPGLYHPVKT